MEEFYERFEEALLHEELVSDRQKAEMGNKGLTDEDKKHERRNAMKERTEHLFDFITDHEKVK